MAYSGTIRTPAKGAKRTKYAPKPKSRSKYPPIVSFKKQPFPAQLWATLRYKATIAVTLSGGIYTHLFRCNGLYDPDHTGTGHQPLYFDQLMGIYNHYTVAASTVRASFTSASSPIGTFSIYIDDDTSASGDNGGERPGGVSVMSNNEASVPTLWKKWSAKDTFGPMWRGQDDLVGTSSTDPTELSFFVIGWQSAGYTGGETCALDVLIEYTAVFDELKTVAQS